MFGGGGEHTTFACVYPFLLSHTFVLKRQLKFRCKSSMMFKPVMLVSLIEIQLQNENRLPEFCSIRMLHKALFQGDWLWCIIPQFATKITSCILRCVDTRFEDDVVWLAPFLTNNVSQLSRTRNTAIYVSVCVVPRKHWFRGFSSEGFPII